MVDIRPILRIVTESAKKGRSLAESEADPRRGALDAAIAPYGNRPPKGERRRIAVHVRLAFRTKRSGPRPFVLARNVGKAAAAALALGAVVASAMCRDARAAERSHVVRTIFVDGAAVSSAAVSVVLPGSSDAVTGIRVGQELADGTRIALPPHVSVVIVSTGAKSTVTLQPGSDVTFVSTGSGEVVSQNGGTSFFRVVTRSLDFFRVQSTRSITAGVRGTEFSVTSGGGAVTVACTNGAVDVEKTGYLRIGSAVKRLSLADVVSPKLKPSITYHPTSMWYLARFENYAQARAAYAAALAHARARGDKHATAVALDNLGTVERYLGRYPEAVAAHEKALALFEQLGDRDGTAFARMHVGNVEQNLSRYADALASHQRALDTFRRLGDRDGEARAMGNIGNALAYLRRPGEALTYHQQALAIFQELADGDGEARQRLNIGTVELDLYRYDDALASFERAAKVFRSVDDLDGEAGAIASAGNLHLAQRRNAEALASSQQAAAMFQRLGNRDAEAAAVANAGVALTRLHRFSDALASQRRALAVFRETGNRTGQVNALDNIARTSWRARSYPEALSAYREALALYEALGERAQADRVRVAIAAVEAHAEAPPD